MNRFLLASLACTLAASPLFALDPALPEAARTNQSTLNDLVRRVPAESRLRERALGKLSAIQEDLVLHERRMRGEGLPPELAEAFCANYSAVIAAVVEDRIPEPYGRELLFIHRQLLERTRHWQTRTFRDEDFPRQVLLNLRHFGEELEGEALPPAEVPGDRRTPLINGYQIWLGEVVAWGEETGRIGLGARSQLQLLSERLERFKGYYKASRRPTAYEYERLHGRWIDTTREAIRILSR